MILFSSLNWSSLIWSHFVGLGPWEPLVLIPPENVKNLETKIGTIMYLVEVKMVLEIYIYENLLESVCLAPTKLRYESIDNCLKDKPRVGTLIC